jgi:curli biogenesis system outer membrane secretion channel CsgG
MKKIILFALGCLILGSLTIALAAEKPRVGVLRFTNITRAYWWSGTTAAELQDMLINELASTKAFQILERKELGSVLSEQQLSESGLVDSSTKSKLGKIKGAKYLVASTVSAFEESTADTGGGLNYRGFSFGGEQKKAYLAIDLKVIDTETGEIVDSRTVEANTTSGGMSISGPSGLVPGLSGGLSKQEKTPVGKAIRGCIIEITDYLECSLASAKDDECHQKYSAKETRRREKTKSSIQLDE